MKVLMHLRRPLHTDHSQLSLSRSKKPTPRHKKPWLFKNLTVGWRTLFQKSFDGGWRCSFKPRRFGIPSP